MTKVNILLVDDQPSKLLTYEAILRQLGERLLTANSAREALEILLKNEVAVILIDVYMPETDGFELAKMIGEHPRFQQTAIIFISAIVLNDVDRLRGYEMGAVDYVPVPVIPEVLRAKVRVFVELYRKTRQLEQLNQELESRVVERTAALADSTTQLQHSEQLRGLALMAGQMGCWEWDALRKIGSWDQGQHTIFGVEATTFRPTVENIWPLIHRTDLKPILQSLRELNSFSSTFQCEFRVRRPNGELRWCLGAAAASFDDANRLTRLAGITVDITDRKMAEERQMLLAEEVDHRARNVVAVLQSILRLTRADNIKEYIAAVDGRISALSNAHRLLANSRWEGADLRKLVEEELAAYRSEDDPRISIDGRAVLLAPAIAQTIALALHELVTNAAKYGALSTDAGRVALTWHVQSDRIDFEWVEFERARGKTADAARLRHTGLFRRDRVPARRRGDLRLASGRPALQAVDTEEQIHAEGTPTVARRQRRAVAGTGFAWQARVIGRGRAYDFADVVRYASPVWPFGRRALQPLRRRDERRAHEQRASRRARHQRRRPENLSAGRGAHRAQDSFRLCHRL